MDSLDYIDTAAGEAHHRAEAEAALPSLATPSLVLIDDTFPSGAPAEDGAQQFRGKGALTVPFLLQHGFTIEWAVSGQVLLARDR